jgi:isocitrate/isopropylmalate dehydrogenase
MAWSTRYVLNFPLCLLWGQEWVGVHAKPVTLISVPIDQVVKVVVESLKIITHTANKHCAEYAFHYAKLYGRKWASAIYKANLTPKIPSVFLTNFCSF